MAVIRYTDSSEDERFYEIQKNCQHINKEVILCDSGPHYAKLLCRKCKAFFKFLSKKDADRTLEAHSAIDYCPLCGDQEYDSAKDKDNRLCRKCKECGTLYSFLKEEKMMIKPNDQQDISVLFEELKEARHQMRLLESKISKLEYDIARKIIIDGLEVKNTPWGMEFLSKDGNMKVEFSCDITTKNKNGEWRIFSCCCDVCKSE